ncbi:MAG: MBL fold metallo-hydrolase [Firmicutes bacterium]|nr:MBL fold metallo-hydrolase [Bacillota bacterium]
MNAQAFLQQVRDTEAPYGTAVLWWMGQMGLWVKLGQTVLSIDYFANPREDRLTPAWVPAEEVTGIDVFLGTHDHEDHIDHPSWQIWARTCPEASFVFPKLHTASILADGISEDRQLGLTDGASVQYKDITIHAIASAHEFLDQDPETGYYPALQYIIEGNGVRLYHAGDTLRYEGMLGKLQSFGTFDAMLVPINGRDAERYLRNCIGNMTFQESVDLAGELMPRLVIPGHWDMFPGNTADPTDFSTYLEAKYGDKVPCLIPKHLEPIVIQH